MVTMIPLRLICTSGITEQQRHAEACCVTKAGFIHSLLTLSFYWATLMKNDDIGIQHVLFCIHKNLSFIDETITCMFPCVFRVHIVMLNNLVGPW